MEIRRKLISFSTYKKKEKDTSLDKEIADTEQSLTQDKEIYLSKRKVTLGNILVQSSLGTYF